MRGESTSTATAADPAREADVRAVCGHAAWRDRDFVVRILSTEGGVAVCVHRTDDQGREIVPTGYREGEDYARMAR
jgi:hypothetical protein